MMVLSIVYSVLLLVMTFASMQFSPRIIVTFMQDRINQVTLGMFLGSLTHSLATLPRIHDRNSDFVPTVAVSFAMLLAVGSLGCLVLFVHNMALSIQVNRIVARIARDTEVVLERLSVRDREWTAQPEAGAAVFESLPSERSGYIQFIDTKVLVAAAQRHAVQIRVQHRMGQFVTKGGVLFAVGPGDRVSPALKRAVSRAVHFGPVRALEDDAEFGVLQIVDIALKAVSPAVNDPSTAIVCVDYLGHVLSVAAALPDPSEGIADDDGVLRVTLPRTNFARLLDIAFDQIPRYARSDVAVSLRILRALSDLAPFATTRDHLNAIRVRGQFVHDLCVRYAPDDELTELKDRLVRVQDATAGAG